MKTKVIFLVSAMLVVSWGCNKQDLSIPNGNQASTASLNSESGAMDYALGIWEKLTGYTGNTLAPSEGGTSGFMIAIGQHGAMGDDMFCPYGNWGLRYIVQPTSIKILGTGNTVFGANGPAGGTNTQKALLQSLNSRAAGENNAFLYEWYTMYAVIGQCNQLLASLPTISISATKKTTLQTWCYWWKGFCYSRIGSMYTAGLIVDNYGQVNANFVTRAAVLAEATSNFDKAITNLGTLSSGGEYDETMAAIVPDFCQNTQVVAPASWIRMINTYKARNILVNLKSKTMTAADWTSVLNMANTGLNSSDNIFWLGQNVGGVRDLSGNFWHPYNINSVVSGFWFSSERTLQQYQPGDARKANGYETWAAYPTTSPGPNIRGRGLLFGTTMTYTRIEDGGLYTSENQTNGFWPVSPTYEENELMKAEANIHLGNIDTGLASVDAVRTLQGAGLAATSGTGLTQAQALVQLVSERRVGLTLRGLAFYDARRWGITEPIASGGGCLGCNVYLPASLATSGVAGVEACDIDYNYMDYFDVPQNEIDFNTPLPGSPAVKQ